MLQRTLSILSECKEIWPLAGRWLEALEKFSRDPKAQARGLGRSMADGVYSSPLYSPVVPNYRKLTNICSCRRILYHEPCMPHLRCCPTQTT